VVRELSKVQMLNGVRINHVHSHRPQMTKAGADNELTAAITINNED